MKESRQGFLAALVAGTAVLSAALSGAANRVAKTLLKAGRKDRSKSEGDTPLWGMVIDLDKCTACGACTVACSQENNLILGSPKEAAMGRINRWIQILPVTEGEYPAPRQELIPMPCQHCEEPPCVRVCPVYSTFLNEEGIVGQVYDRCIGCRYCVNACPYTCKYFNWEAPAWPKELRASLNPDVYVRPVGVVEKCLFCHHRLQRAKEEARAEGRPLREKNYQPACAEVCPAKAIVFGNLHDKESDVSVISKNPRAFHLQESLGTEPKVTYLREGA